MKMPKLGDLIFIYSGNPYKFTPGYYIVVSVQERDNMFGLDRNFYPPGSTICCRITDILTESFYRVIG
jgi:hypothetical protein